MTTDQAVQAPQTESGAQSGRPIMSLPGSRSDKSVHLGKFNSNLLGWNWSGRSGKRRVVVEWTRFGSWRRHVWESEIPGWGLEDPCRPCPKTVRRVDRKQAACDTRKDPNVVRRPNQKLRRSPSLPIWAHECFPRTMTTWTRVPGWGLSHYSKELFMCAGCSSRKKQRTPAAMVSWSCFDAQKGEEQSALWTVVEALASRHVHRALRTWPVEQRRPSQELWAYRSCQKCMRETHRRHRVLHHRSRALPNLCRRCFHVAANGFFSDPGSKLKGRFPERVFLRAGELLPSPMERISAGALMDQVSMGEPPVTPYLLRRMSLNSQLEQITVSPGHSPLNACLGGRALPDRRSDKAPSCRSGLNLGPPKGSCRMSDSPKKGADAISSQWISSGNSGTPIRPPSWVLMVDCAFDCNRNRDSGEMEDEEEADPESALGDLGDDESVEYRQVGTPRDAKASMPVATALNPLHLAP